MMRTKDPPSLMPAVLPVRWENAFPIQAAMVQGKPEASRYIKFGHRFHSHTSCTHPRLDSDKS